MRLSLFILGVFSTVISIEKPAQAQNQASRVIRSAGSQHWNNAWPTGSGTATVHPVRTHPRRAHRADAQAVTPSNGYGLRKSFGNFAFHCDRQKPIP
jgi:hypothetical protein